MRRTAEACGGTRPDSLSLWKRGEVVCYLSQPMPIDYTVASDRWYPRPSDPWECARIDEQARRRRIMCEEHDQDVESWLVATFGKRRRIILGPKNLSRNFLASSSSQLASLYGLRPEVTNPAGVFPEIVGQDIPLAALDENGERKTTRQRGLLERGGLWATMPRIQQLTVGMNEMLLVPSITTERDTPRLTFRPVFPDQVWIDADPDDPACMIRLYEIRERPDPREGKNGAMIYVQDRWDISDPENPMFQVVTVDGDGSAGVDITKLVFPKTPNLSGKDYPRHYSDGTPYIPHQLYHRSWPATTWDPFFNRRVVDGTLNLTVLWTLRDHVLRDGAATTKYIAGGHIVTDAVVGTSDGPVETAMNDAVAVLRIARDESNDGTMLIGQWAPALDPEAFTRAILAGQAELAESIGIDQSDLIRTSSDATSGAALTISKQAKQEERVRHAPIMQPADEEMIGKCCALLNQALDGAVYPEDGWVVEHSIKRDDMPVVKMPNPVAAAA